MPIETLRPASTVQQGDWAIVGGSTVHGVLSDNSTSTRIDTNATPSSISEANGAITTFGAASAPSASKITAVRQRWQMPLGIKGSWRGSWRVGAGGLSGPLEEIAWTTGELEPIPTIMESPWRSAPPGGTEWTWADIAALRINLWWLTVTGQTAGARNYFELFIDVDYNEQPVATATAPTGTITDTSRPTAEWTYSDPENDPQAGFQVLVFHGADEPGGGWPADPAGIPGDPVYDSGDTSGADTSHQIADLPDGDAAYACYIRARQAWSGPTPHWSAWDLTTFALDLDAPPAPAVALTPEPGQARMLVEVSSAAPGAGEIEPEWYEIERSDDAGATWVQGRGTLQGELTPDGSRDAAIHDHEPPFDAEVRYRARSAGTNDGAVAVGPWSTVQAATVETGNTRWLTDPLDPDAGMVVRVVSPQDSWEARQHVHRPADSDLAVVETEPAVLSRTLAIWALDAAEHDKLQTLVTSGRTLLYRDRRSHTYVRWIGARQRSQVGPDRSNVDSFSGTAIEVARPPL